MLLSLKEIYSKNRIYFIPLFLFWILGIFKFIFSPHGNEFYFLNSYHNYFLDTFFKYATYLGDGLVQAILLIPLLIKRFRIYIVWIIAHLVSGGFAQILKKIFEEPRPKHYFSDFLYFHQVAGEKLYSNFSFPSGHTTSVFALTIILSIITENKALKFLFFIIALIVALSRMYLLQHFFIDVYFGSIIGVVFGLLIYIIFINRKQNKELQFQSLPEYIRERRKKTK